MAIRNIVQEGDDILNKKCRIVDKFDKRLIELIDDLTETLYEAGGAGLAAPQVGVRRRVAVVDVDEESGLIELINPEIIYESEEKETDMEGCMSFEGQWGLVERPLKVKVKAQDRDGKFFEVEGEGLLARCFCHEIDHLNGIVFKERAVRMLSEEEIENRRRLQEQKAKEKVVNDDESKK